MAKAKFISGDIFAIPLPNGLGFAFAKGIFLPDISSGTNYPVMIRVYNYRSEDGSVNLVELKNTPLILSPLLIAGINEVLSREIWKIVGNIPLEEVDKIVPDYKTDSVINKEGHREWFYVSNASIETKKKLQHEKLKHLESLGAAGASLVNTKIAMALLKDEGKDLSNYFELREFFEKEYHNEVIEIEAYYKQPKTNRGKAFID
jgi:hypothetical protein